MLIDAHSDRILGLTAFRVEASELMAAVQTAMLGELSYTVPRDAIFTHPTIAEGLTFLLASVACEGGTKGRLDRSIDASASQLVVKIGTECSYKHREITRWSSKSQSDRDERSWTESWGTRF